LAFEERKRHIEEALPSSYRYPFFCSSLPSNATRRDTVFSSARSLKAGRRWVLLLRA
jgi:hypothetical protein